MYSERIHNRTDEPPWGALFVSKRVHLMEATMLVSCTCYSQSTTRNMTARQATYSVYRVFP